MVENRQPPVDGYRLVVDGEREVLNARPHEVAYLAGGTANVEVQMPGPAGPAGGLRVGPAVPGVDHHRVLAEALDEALRRCPEVVDPLRVLKPAGDAAHAVAADLQVGRVVGGVEFDAVHPLDDDDALGVG